MHILKCIRNNWINQKNDQICFYFPEIQGDTPESERMQTASFATIRDLHSKECDQLLKYGYGLSRKALYPSSLERQDVKLALQIFNDYLPEALRALGAKHNLFSFEAMATFVEIILKWWKIVNVKTPWKGERLRDHFQQPVLSIDNDPKIDFLHMFLKWLDERKNKGFDNGTLTKETHAALEHTTYALVELARYSFEELGMSYVLFGKIQTDCLEDRFGKYRQLAVSPDQHWECVRKQVEALLPSSNVVVTSQALTKMLDVVPVLVYVAGYAVYGTLKKLKCEQCRDSLTVDKKITVSATNEHYGLVKQLDRGGLVYPSMFALNAVAHSYVVVEQLATEPALLMMPEQRQVVTKMTLQLLASEEQSDFDTWCCLRPPRAESYWEEAPKREEVSKQVARRLVVLPLPRNVHPDRNKERRVARARALAETYADDAKAVYVDAAKHQRKPKTYVAAVVRATDGNVLNACSVRATSAEQAEEAAIALALSGIPEATTILSDSRTAIANFGRGSVGTPAASLLPRAKSTTTHLRWFPAHVGVIPGGAANRNEEADVVARELAYRAAPPRPSEADEADILDRTRYWTTEESSLGTERAAERCLGLTRD
ncbi:hypothetical protein HPB49_008015 [Dermacentor silvarum]|uniref:Uncharacterized protein n=1 Tax=Dermacentor silvarum TaxID=543639 RepID=A0ACB8D3U4_DERSI|nr:hypothetical protein HPB49_008015 [Dermacentor silvarum]